MQEMNILHSLYVIFNLTKCQKSKKKLMDNDSVFHHNFLHSVEICMTMIHESFFQANYQAISDKLQEQESDRIQLVQRIKELQEKVRIEF